MGQSWELREPQQRLWVHARHQRNRGKEGGLFAHWREQSRVLCEGGLHRRRFVGCRRVVGCGACQAGLSRDGADPDRPRAQVICLDNFFTGSKDNIKHLIGKPNFELMRCARTGCWTHALIPTAAVSSRSHMPGSVCAARRETGACSVELTVVSCARVLDLIWRISDVGMQARRGGAACAGGGSDFPPRLPSLARPLQVRWKPPSSVADEK